jgi:hypothetical protein
LLILGLLTACNPFAGAEQAPAPTAAPPTATAVAVVPTDIAPTTTVAQATATAPADNATATAAAPTEAAPTAPTAAAATTGTPATPVAAATIPPAMAEQINRIEAEAAALRGLTPKTDVPEYVVSSGQIAENLKQEIAQEYPRDQARRDALELWLMRFINDQSLDLFQVQVDLLGEQVLGYYDQDKKDLFVRNDQQPLSPLAQETLAHEFVHSLQDEYYDLKKLTPRNSHNGDRDTAVTSLIEGDATISGILFAQKYMSKAEFQELLKEDSSGSTKVLDQVPLYVRESLQFPYDQGVKFVLTLYQRGGFPQINKAFQDPPTSTEQILHPEKYLNSPRDVPKAVDLVPLTDTLGAGWTMQDTNTLGEFDLDALLRTNNVNNPAAAAGWGGARYALYQGNGGAVVLLATRWDTAKDADEFSAALTQSLSKAAKDGAVWNDNGRFLGITHMGDQVTMVSGTERAAVERALAAVK